MKHLLSMDDLSLGELQQMLSLADEMSEIQKRAQPKVPALRNKTVASLFFEDSTRTRLSFETAAKRLSADTMTFSAASSSVNKGESLRDTVETLSAMGVDAFVVRHKTAGLPLAMTQWTDAHIVNAGDGAHQHPTQALLDAFTLTRALEMGNSLAGVRVAMVGDIRHSRVARSTVRAFVLLGAKVTLVAPASLLPPSLIYSDTADTRHEWPVSTSHDLDEVLGDVDVVYLLRMQHERMNAAFISSVGEYALHFGLTPQRLAKLPHSFKLMHPGPMNHGVEIVVDPALVPGSLITQQVTNGVSVRMAVLLSLLGPAATSELTKEEKNV